VKTNVTRTVKNGAVRIYGFDFVPADPHREYKGELEGKRVRFGLYKRGYIPEGFITDFVAMVDDFMEGDIFCFMFWQRKEVAG
jgi:hypothetical protein